VITPTQFGEGNFRNLEAAETALNEGIPVVLMENGAVGERDFTKGKATKALEKLKSKGAVTVKNNCELLEFLDTLEHKNSGNSSQKKEP
jgi:hypothetical protein